MTLSVALSMAMVTTDTTDAMALASWWATATGAEVGETNDGWYVMVRGGGLPVTLAFQKVEEVTPGKNRLHLDLLTEDIDATADELIAAGATLVAKRGDESFRWITLADPDGNEFCIAPKH